ncbi:cryptochrome/photolyase family protein [Ancylobacter terrae]|uniref:cryptochrome/photolyase family protein n=1 Tax=Ancylobacter sp. sgz301288 TaxID=3342077 RepID=UPI003858A744
MSQTPVLVWFREDLRLSDNPALDHAVATGAPLLLLYILDEASPGVRPLGGATRWWLSRSLAALSADIARKGGHLILRRGAAGPIVEDLVAQHDVRTVCWNRRYTAAGIAVDRGLKEALKAKGVGVETFNGSLLDEPWTVKTKAGEPFRVFTPYHRAAREHAPPAPTRAPKALPPGPACASDDLDGWRLEPTRPDWAGGLRRAWTPGEAGGQTRLGDFLDVGLKGYAVKRDRPDRDNVSRLSPHLHFGEVSPRQVLAGAQLAGEDGRANSADVAKFVAELYWREFSYHLLFHVPDLATRNFQPRFDAFPWQDDEALLTAWQRGRTGYPIVDAGMRQLRETGWMHNRVRMVTASFLIKHGLVDWRRGEAWFWDTLVDADPASNAASWQWVAGSGADAAPYFRIFNPVLQGEKFDPDGAYVRRYVPELGALPARVIHRPWEAGAARPADYPAPVVDHAAARARALDAYERMRAEAGG